MTTTAQNFTVYQGNNALPQWTVLNAAGAAVDISTVTQIQWVLSRDETTPALITKTKTGGAGGVSFVTNGTDGKFQVAIAPADLTGLSGVFFYTASITDAGGNVSTVVVGSMSVAPTPGTTWAWSGDPMTGDKDVVRFLIGDTIAGDQQVNDAVILWALTQRSSVWGAAAIVCRGMAAQFSRKVDVVHGMGPMQDRFSQQAQAYERQAIAFEQQATLAGAGAPFAGGISITQKQNQEQDPDRVSPSFNIGMEDNLLPVGPVGNETSTGQQPSGVNAVVAIP